MQQTSTTAAGTLYVVATPIGNLNDITLRAIEVLSSCDYVACEDTRHSQRLFQAHDIQAKAIALHQHNENHHSQKIIELLKTGKHVALVSDAGTPLISDPGFPLLQLAHEHGIKVTPIPGASAVTALLSVAALNTQPFIFHGFIPPKVNQRLSSFQAWLDVEGTHVFYESSHRIMASVEQLACVFEHAEVVMGRELTKTFEQVFKGSPSELLELIQRDKNHQKGEFVLAVQNKAQHSDNEISAKAIDLINQLTPLLPPKVAAKVVADHYQLNKKQVYQFILQQE